MLMVSLYLAVSYLSGIAAIVHAVTRPESQWIQADRDKARWVTLLVLGTLIGLGIVVSIVYGVAIAPLLASKGAGPGTSSEFEKR